MRIFASLEGSASCPPHIRRSSAPTWVAVARQGDKSRAQVARSFGISESCLARWLRIADRDDGEDRAAPAEASSSSLEVENRELRKRTKQLEQENEILRRAAAFFARELPPK